MNPKVNSALHIISFVLISLLVLDRVGVFGEKEKKAKPVSQQGEGFNFAYIHSDSLSANYKFIAERAKELAEKEQKLTEKLNIKVKKLETRFAQLQSKADIMTRAELEAAQAEVQSMEMEINQLRMQLAQELDQERIKMQMELYKRVEDVLKDKAAEHGYQTIYSYTQGGQVLYINPDRNITDEVLEVLNAEKSEE
ncbi:OmpH family outer membrane protein [Luteibaculum oceani]|uniref:OmpH family outer membrane protein n=1 Tax=Luteibaculum oceani TaxID=1294296 RepID=A0A5C6VCW9_9FLAO|nr:OmpH family outer membrane protein [Luteibaculum oceani]TXC81435.1 OmpH family outer membrane protein [Luteibaculum oceani]